MFQHKNVNHFKNKSHGWTPGLLKNRSGQKSNEKTVEKPAPVAEEDNWHRAVFKFLGKARLGHLEVEFEKSLYYNVVKN